MLSFSAVAKEELCLPEVWEGSLWPHRYQPQMRRPHRHDELEFNLVTAGRATYLLGDRRYDLARNTLVWLFPAQDHILLDESGDYAMWIGVFKPGLLERVCTTREAEILRETVPPGGFCRQVSEAWGERLCALFAEIKGTERDKAWLNAGLGYALLSAWTAYAAAEETAAGPDVHPAVERAARLLRDDPNPLPMEQLAARAGLSASHLSRLFHRQTGISLGDFRNRQRLQRFLRLYGTGKRVSMLNAALDAGFGSYAQFYRVFQQQMGCSPAEHRRKQGKGISASHGEPERILTFSPKEP